MAKKITTVKVEFCGAVLEGVVVNGKAYVAMKPIVEGMGLKWNDQLEKMKKHPVLGPEVSPLSGIPSAGGPQTMICLPENRLQFWMAIVNPLKVKELIRDKVVRYQKEAADVLHSAFTNGVAETNMRVMAIDSKRAAGRLMTDMKADVLRMIGKDAKPYDFSNEHRMVNWALTGEFGPVDEATLSDLQIDLLAELRRRNSVLIGRGVEYEDRKKMLEQHAKDWQHSRHVVIQSTVKAA